MHECRILNVYLTAISRSSPSPHLLNTQTVVRGTPFDTVSKDELAVENKAMAGKSVFERAMADFNGRYPAVAALGLGPSAKAERWNGRHAMFGWIVLLATGYAQAHGLLPEGGMDAKEWGTVSFIIGGE